MLDIQGQLHIRGNSGVAIIKASTLLGTSHAEYLTEGAGRMDRGHVTITSLMTSDTDVKTVLLSYMAT